MSNRPEALSRSGALQLSSESRKKSQLIISTPKNSKNNNNLEENVIVKRTKTQEKNKKRREYLKMNKGIVRTLNINNVQSNGKQIFMHFYFFFK